MFLCYVRIIFHMFTGEEVRVQARGHGTNVVHRLLRVRRFSVASLTFPVANGFSNLVPRLFRLLRSSQGVLMRLITWEVSLWASILNHHHFRDNEYHELHYGNVPCLANRRTARHGRKHIFRGISSVSRNLLGLSYSGNVVLF